MTSKLLRHDYDKQIMVVQLRQANYGDTVMTSKLQWYDYNRQTTVIRL